MLYEIGYLQNGEVVHGGIKGPLLTVGKWLKQNMAADPNGVYVIVPADEDAITNEQFLAECEEQQD